MEGGEEKGKEEERGEIKDFLKTQKINKLSKVFLKMDQRCSLIVALFARR